MADEIKYERKTVQTVRGTTGLVVAKMQKDGWEFVDQTNGTVRTSLNFRRPKKQVPWVWVGAAAAGAVLLATIIAVGAAREGHDGKPGSDQPGTSARDSMGAPKESTYSSARELMDAAIKAGYPCPSQKVRTDIGINTPDDGSCSDNDSFQILDLTRHGDDLKEFINGIVHNPDQALSASQKGQTYLVGANWVIFGDLVPLKNIRKTIGGTIATPLGH